LCFKHFDPLPNLINGCCNRQIKKSIEINIYEGFVKL